MVPREGMAQAPTTDREVPGGLGRLAEYPRMQLRYENELGNARVKRTFVNFGRFVREVTIESGYNYPAEEWQVYHRYIREYDLESDGETLAGDGSDWDGTGRHWRAWFAERHRQLLSLRFPHDDLSDLEE